MELYNDLVLAQNKNLAKMKTINTKKYPKLRRMADASLVRKY